MKHLNNQRGISLVEILVALVISLFLLAGIVQVYTGNRATFSFTNALAEVQENGRFALDLMSQDLRLTSVWGCIQFNPNDTTNINDTLAAATVPGFDTAFHDFVDEDNISGTNNTGLNGSDTLTVRGGKTGQANVESPFFAATSNQINEEADIHRVTASLPFNGNTQRQLTFAANKSQQFENDAVVIELQTVNYFIAAGASGEPALFRQEFDNAAQELVEGVEELQILYGVDSDNDEFPNQYQTADVVAHFNALARFVAGVRYAEAPEPADVVADFNDVVSVRISLLVRSVDDFVTEDPQTYTYNGATVTAGDRRIRQSFSSTIALRNRIGS